MKRYWFKRKLFGWGWQPATWEGWLVLFGFVAISFANFFFRYTDRIDVSETLAYRFAFDTFVLVIILMIICLRTGEKPRWQWGKRIEDKDDTDPNAPR
ncbi:MAG: hypothetical protein ACD_48C00001G0003 [uncultured bacterium]|nr:MAG: hypothetical protein ACD_48C00001G0003 [uncultured bacterium]